ncbi:MAG: TetR/AcrR family transcriptional regulator [Bombilactobacillus sp.]
MVQVVANYEKRLESEKMPPGRKKVLIASLKLFAKQGFYQTTTAQIAKKAGVSEGTIYNYFKTKDDLLTQLLSPLFTEIKTKFMRKLDQFQKLDALVDFIITDRLAFIKTNFDFFKLIFQEILTGNELNNVIKDAATTHGSLQTNIQDLQKRIPEINPNLSAIQVVRILLGPILAYIMQEQLFKIESNNSKTDLSLIKMQIIAGLTR